MDVTAPFSTKPNNWQNSSPERESHHTWRQNAACSWTSDMRAALTLGPSHLACVWVQDEYTDCILASRTQSHCHCFTFRKTSYWTMSNPEENVIRLTSELNWGYVRLTLFWSCAGTSRPTLLRVMYQRLCLRESAAQVAFGTGEDAHNPVS